METFQKWKVTCNWKLPKMESFSPQNYMSKNASNEILFHMKVVDLALTFPKSPITWNSHLWLASYDQIIVQKSWISKWHNFWFTRPNGVRLFWANFFWSPLSKTSITCHENSSHKKSIFQVNQFWKREGKSAFWEISLVFTWFQLH